MADTDADLFLFSPNKPPLTENSTCAEVSRAQFAKNHPEVSNIDQSTPAGRSSLPRKQYSTVRLEPCCLLRDGKAILLPFSCMATKAEPE
jgi:hypothetical protein